MRIKCERCGEYFYSELRNHVCKTNDIVDDLANMAIGYGLSSLLSSDDSDSNSSSNDYGSSSSNDDVGSGSFDGGSFGGAGADGDW